MANNKQLNPGDTIVIRLPVDTPQEVIDYLNDLRMTSSDKSKKTSFNFECSNIFVGAIKEILDAQLVKIITPEPLTLRQEKWLNDPYTRVFLGKYLFQFINDPDKINRNVNV